MTIGSITSAHSISNMQTTAAGSAEPKTKNIQNEITAARQQMQALSSKEELSVNEKADERKKLQKEISSLNTELKQYEEQFRKSQRREIMMEELQEDSGRAKAAKPFDGGMDTEPSREETPESVSAASSAPQAGQQGTVIANTSDGIVILKENLKPNEQNPPIDSLQTEEPKKDADVKKETKTSGSDPDKDTGLSSKKIHALVSADHSVQQAKRQETVIARLQDGIVILKSEIKQDEQRGVDTEKKQDELEKLEKKEERARAFQSSVFGAANNTMKSEANTKESETKTNAQVNIENSAFKLFQQEDPASEQHFYISLTN